ncbi:MAG: 16S rRNA (guanine(966)-N(2))-methyltransferase RsmD [Desulfobacca sp.]|nr:16S rRNA (guanine(966)-N(2))-methyltransferase RsmD [Desulfobacca sp.]
MRIISGTGKGRQLAPLKGRQTRPTQDKVREAIFNILESNGPFLRVIDLFAGSGAMGLEALSRWGGKAVFVESSREAIICLRENIGRLKMEDKAQVIQGDLGKGINFLKKIGGPFDLVFMDPPYGQGWCNVIIPKLLTSSIVESTGIVALEHDLKEPIPLQVGDWEIGDQRRYGQTRVSFYTCLKR